MTWANRFKFTFGLIAVLGIVRAATLVFNQRQTRVDSETATIAAATIQVGSDYSGLVTEVFVEPGDYVATGDQLFTIQSVQFERDLAVNAVSATRPVASTDGTLAVLSSVDGVVSDVTTEVGGLAQVGAPLAEVDQTGTLFVEATFRLSPRDFGRIEDGATVEFMLPNQRVVSGTVSTLDVETVDGDAVVTVHVDAENLMWGDENGLVKPGTPVEATLYLRDDGPLAGVADMVKSFLHRIGA